MNTYISIIFGIFFLIVNSLHANETCELFPARELKFEHSRVRDAAKLRKTILLVGTRQSRPYILEQ